MTISHTGVIPESYSNVLPGKVLVTHVMGITNHFLIGFQAPLLVNSCLAPLTWLRKHGWVGLLF